MTSFDPVVRITEYLHGHAPELGLEPLGDLNVEFLGEDLTRGLQEWSQGQSPL